MVTRTMLQFAAAAIVFAGVAMAVLWTTETIGQGDDPSQEMPPDFELLPPEKPALELAERAERAAAEAGPHAPKVATGALVISCPVDLTKVPTGVWPFEFGPFPGGRSLVNEASAISSLGVPYRIFAGALDEDPEQGLVMVAPSSADPCATSAGLIPQEQLRFHQTLSRSGPVTIIQIDGDAVIFSDSTGKEGRLNYVTGQFDGGPVPTMVPLQATSAVPGPTASPSPPPVVPQ